MECRACSLPLADGAHYCSACGTDQTDPGSARTTGGSPRDEAALLQDLATRTLAGRYAVRHLLGAGGMASVFLADDLTLERTVAIKVLPTDMAHDERVVARFQREAKTAAKLDHPHIIPIYRVESEGILNYFVMKYVEGRSLDRVMREQGALDLAFAERVLSEAASALAHAHRKGVVHRDIKPANIMLDADDRVILTDFGISKAVEATSQLTQTGTIMGTPSYMAPEQVLGRPVDGRADQYALAVLGYHMITGRLPFDGETAHAILYQHVHEAPPRPSAARPDVPARIDDALVRGMDKDPAARFRTTGEFADALRGVTGAARGAATPGPSLQTVAMTADGATVRVATRDPGVMTDAAGARKKSPPDRTAAARSRGPGQDPPSGGARRRRMSVRWVGVGAVVVLATGAATWATRRGGGADPSLRGSSPTRGAVARPVAESGHVSTDTAVGAASITPPPLTGAASSATTVAGLSSATTVPPAPAQAADAAGASGSTSAPVIRTSSHSASRAPAHRAVSAPARQPNPAPLPPGPPADQGRRMAPLTVNSDPYGTLYVDGVEVGFTPQADYLLAVGRTYEIRVERDGYKSKREMISVTGPNEIRKRYLLEPMGPP